MSKWYFMGIVPPIENHGGEYLRARSFFVYHSSSVTEMHSYENKTSSLSIDAPRHRLHRGEQDDPSLNSLW
jgi:hypothetical protein